MIWNFEKDYGIMEGRYGRFGFCIAINVGLVGLS